MDAYTLYTKIDVGVYYSPTMEALEIIALFFHPIGFAALFGVSAVQVRLPVRIAKNGMMHGALTQLVSGFVLMRTKSPDIWPHAAGGTRH